MDPSMSVDGLRGLSQDLSVLKHSGQSNLDALAVQLENQLDALSSLLDKKPRSAPSRQILTQGKVTLDEITFECNKEFQEQVIVLSDTLDLDELEATRLYILAEEESADLDRSPIALAIINFHQYRIYLLECLRRICELSLSEEVDEHHRKLFTECVSLIVDNSGKPGPRGLSFVKRCMAEMLDIEGWLHRIAEQVQKNVALNTTTDPDMDEILHAQQESLVRQHEYLAMIVSYLIKGNKSIQDDFTTMISHISKMDKWNMVTVHYVPSLLAFTSQYGAEGSHTIGLPEVKALSKQILGARDTQPWPLRHLQAAFITWWLAEYNGWFFEQAVGAESDTETDKKERDDAFTTALRDGGFSCTLSICSYLNSHDWLDPSRLALTRSLLTESLSLPNDIHEVEPEFRELMMEQLESFTDAFVTNMPDTLRKFKAEEDDERRKHLAGLANGNTGSNSHVLETFFLVVSYAYEKRPNSANHFWEDTESNLYGFLQWASRRQSTPVISAFCEMFRSVSEGTHADAAHRFLIEESATPQGRVRKAATMNWTEIFDELGFYAEKIKHNPAPVPSTVPGGKAVIADFDEPESITMLENYLRLISHLCRQSVLVREWFLEHPSFKIIDTALLLCRSNSPAPIRTCAYGCLEALLTQKKQEVNDIIWTAVDHWITNDFCTKPPNKTGPPIEEIAFRTIAANTDEASAFTSLLVALIVLPDSVGPLSDRLPFPEQLGSAYRMPGLDAYVDFVFGKLLCQTLPAVQGSLKAQILASHILGFAVTCLSSFNEDLVILANRPGVNVELGMGASSLLNYVRLHPSNRVMEWMFNERAAKVLFHTSHHDISELNVYSSESPIVASVFHAIHLMTKVLNLQPTFLNVIRPLLKSQPYRTDREVVADASIAFFEDNIASNLRIVPDLLYYSGSPHEQLSLASLRLIAKIARSKKLNTHGLQRVRGATTQNRLISVLEQDRDVEPISRGLAQRMVFDPKEFAEGPGAPGFQTKIAILDFLLETLGDVSDRPNVAHALLGLDCVGNRLSVSEDGSFARGESLFHAIIRLAVEFPEAAEGSLLEWALDLRQKVWHIVELLWSSSVSSAPILADLRENGYITSRWPSQIILDAQTLFEGFAVGDDWFYFKGSPDTLVLYFEQRKTLLNYAATELRLASSQSLEMLRAQLTSTMYYGVTSTEAGNLQHATIFNFLDFMELEIPPEFPLQISHKWHEGLSNQIDDIARIAETPFEERLEMISQLLTLREREQLGAMQLNEEELERLRQAHNDILMRVTSSEKYSIMLQTRLSLLKAWVNLVSLFLEHAVMEDNDKKMLVLQAFQVTSPKLEFFASQARPEALVFAELAQILLGHLNLNDQNAGVANGANGNVNTELAIDDGTSERLFSLYRVSLRTICMPTTEAELRTALYNICYRYLSKPMEHEVSARCVPIIKTMGEGLLDAVCEDAYSGEFNCRVAALMLLEAFVNLESYHKSSYVVASMDRANFIVVLVENIKEMPREAQQTSPSDIPSLILYYKAQLTLLLALSRTRTGAGHVHNAGLFAAINASGLFATDPDLGLDIDTPDALNRYYELLLAILQVIVSVVLSRGSQNSQTIDQVRSFLLANRPLMIGLLKRQAGIGFREPSQEKDEDMQGLLNDLSELYVLLISSTGFMEEEQQDTQRNRRKFFS